ncbi:MAG: PEP-CTERM sorting domain-containing protein [Nitrospirales bacterium]
MKITTRTQVLAKGLATSITALVLLGGMATSASAGSIIFKDNFNRGHGWYKKNSHVGNGWQETERNYNDTGIAYNHLQLRDARGGSGPDAAATRLIDTTGYQNVYLMYDFKPMHSSDGWDYLHVDFRALGSSNWTNLASHSLGGSAHKWTWNTAYLGAAATDTKLQLRFWTDVSEPYRYRHWNHYHTVTPGAYEGAYIDAVKLWGDPVPQTTATPEPSTMALFATGLVGMGVWRARRNKSEQSA